MIHDSYLMNRDDLALQAPKWIKLKSRPAEEQWRRSVEFIEVIIDAIILDVREPEIWEATYIAHALHALVEGRYDAAITFSELALNLEPCTEPPPRLSHDGERLRLADLELALEALKALGAPRPTPRRA